MPKGQGLDDLRQRKKKLLLESDINRQIVRVEFCQLRLKASEWRSSLLKARTAYNFIAPLAGIGFAIFAMRKKMHAHAATKHNGRGRRKSAYLNLLAPLGMAALRKAYGFWRHARRRDAST
jgi:hypothetical protein